MQERRENSEVEISLQEVVILLLRKWKLLLLGIIIGGILAGGCTYIKTPMYESRSMIFILSKTTSITSMADVQLGSELSTDFAVIATSKPVIDAAIADVRRDRGISLTREDVSKMITVTNKEDTRILEIKAVSEDPQLACDLVNAMTDATSSQMAAIMKSDPPTTVERAEVAEEPVDNGLVKNSVIGAFIGFIIMAVISVVPFLLNDRINTAEDVENYLDVSVLGIIPLDKAQQEKKTHKKRKKVKHSS